jgi:hypothetical protein
MTTQHDEGRVIVHGRLVLKLHRIDEFEGAAHVEPCQLTPVIR